MRRLLLIACLAFSALAFRCPDKPLPQTDADWQGMRPTGVFAKTDRGVKVESSSAIDATITTGIDLGLSDLFDIAKGSPYNYGGRFTDDFTKWHVWLMPPNRIKCIDPAFTLRTTSPLYPAGWDQDPVFDKDPKVGTVLLCVAGFMAREGNEPGMVIVASSAIDRNTARNEGEHNVLFEADPDKFKQSENNHAHPLMPRPGGSRLIILETDSRTAFVRLDELFVLPDSFSPYGSTRIHVLLSK